LTQENLAEETDLSHRTIWNAERSGERISLDSLRRLAEYFDVPVEELIHPQDQGRATGPRVRHVWRGDLPTPGSAVFVGREDSLAKLDDAWHTETCHVVVVVGGWGQGKSALIHEWLNRMAEDDYRGAEWVVGLSFRGQGTEGRGGVDDYFQRALMYFDDPNPDSGLEDGKAVRLVNRIRRHRTLFVLDGLEPLQSPPTVQEEGGKVTNAALRALILNLADQMNGLCVISSRFPVLDLADRVRDDPAAAVREIRLGPLGVEAAVEFLRSRKLTGSPRDFRSAATAYKAHPLSLSALAGVLTRRHGGKISRWPDAVTDDPTIEKILTSLEGLLDEEEKAVMTVLGLFDGPAGAGAISALRAGPPIPGLTDALQKLDDGEWAALLTRLRELQVLTGEDNPWPCDLDCHPEVRAYFARRLRDLPAASREEGQRCLYQHYAEAADAGSVNDLYLAVHHGCEAGRHAEVFDELVWKKMNSGFAFSRLNGHGAGTRDLRLLRQFLSEWGESGPGADRGVGRLTRPRFFLWAGTVEFILGQVGEAVAFTGRARAVFQGIKDKKAEDWLGVCFSTAYLGWFLAAQGKLEGALRLFEEAIGYADRHLPGEPFWRKIGLGCRACALAYLGRCEEAVDCFDTARRLECDAPEGFGVSWGILMFHYACHLLKRGRYEEAEREADRLHKMANQGNPVLGFLGHQVRGRAELARLMSKPGTRRLAQRTGPLAHAERHLALAEDDLNRCPAQDMIIASALSLAQCRRMRGDLDAAARELQRAEEAVESFVLLRIDCLLERARLCLARGATDEAAENREKACDLVREHRYHYVDPELQDLAKQLRKA
jgi:tetratricopeptide (TPR) repeat protein